MSMVKRQMRINCCFLFCNYICTLIHGVCAGTEWESKKIHHVNWMNKRKLVEIVARRWIDPFLYRASRILLCDALIKQVKKSKFTLPCSQCPRAYRLDLFNRYVHRLRSIQNISELKTVKHFRAVLSKYGHC